MASKVKFWSILVDHPDLSPIILKSHDHGGQLKKNFNFTVCHIKSSEKSPNFKELV